MALTGRCDYCGQSMVIDERKFPLVNPDDQAAVDMAVTSICDCPQAKSDRRRQETAQRIDTFIREQLPPEAKGLFEAAVANIRDFKVTSVTIEDNDGWKNKIRVDTEGYLCIDRKKSLSKKEKF